MTKLFSKMLSPFTNDRLIKFLPALIFLAGMLTILLHAGSAGLFETSEGRYASVARQMLDSNDWFTPRHNGLKHFTKPPMTYWITATGMKLFGVNEFGARFFLSLAAGLTALGTYLTGKLLFCKRTGALAAIIMTTSVFFQIQFRGLTTDPYLTLFETAMALSFLSFVRKNRRHWEIAFWLSTSLAMLTKGPPGLLPLAGLIPAALITGYGDRLRKLFTSAAGWTIFFILGLGWYLLIAATNPGLLSYFLIDETVKRVASNDHQRSAPFIYYFILLPAGLFPWSGFFLAGIKDICKKFRSDANSTFLLLWTAVPVLIFTISRSKLAGYALPLLVPCSLISAVTMLKLSKKNCDNRLTWKQHAAISAIVTLLSGIAFCGWGTVNAKHLTPISQVAFYAGGFWIFAGLCLLSFLYLRKHQSSFFVLAMIIPGLLFITLAGIKGNEKISDSRYLGSPWMLLKRIATLPPDQKIICIDRMIEGWYFYTGRNVITWNVQRITKFDNERADGLVLMGEESLINNTTPDTLFVLRQKDVKKIESILKKSIKPLTHEGNWLVAFPGERIGQ